MFKKLKAFTASLINSPHLFWGVSLASFLESIIVPIPLEALLIPAMQARRDKIVMLTLAAILGCVAGAVVGYAVGFFVFEAVGSQLVELFWNAEQYQQVKQQMQVHGFWFVLSVGIIPIPFQLAMLAAGATGYCLCWQRLSPEACVMLPWAYWSGSLVMPHKPFLNATKSKFRSLY